MKYLLMATGAVVLLWCVSIDRMPQEHNKAVAAKVQIDNFLAALGAYQEDVGSFPTTDEGLQALRLNPGHAGWKGPYLPKDIPLDPWGQPYIYTYTGAHGKLSEIVSYGADRRPGGDGINSDIVSWQR